MERVILSLIRLEDTTIRVYRGVLDIGCVVESTR